MPSKGIEGGLDRRVGNRLRESHATVRPRRIARRRENRNPPLRPAGGRGRPPDRDDPAMARHDRSLAERRPMRRASGRDRTCRSAERTVSSVAVICKGQILIDSAFPGPLPIGTVSPDAGATSRRGETEPASRDRRVARPGAGSRHPVQPRPDPCPCRPPPSRQHWRRGSGNLPGVPAGLTGDDVPHPSRARIEGSGARGRIRRPYWRKPASSNDPVRQGDELPDDAKTENHGAVRRRAGRRHRTGRQCAFPALDTVPAAVR